jgi:LVIVD repeat
MITRSFATLLAAALAASLCVGCSAGSAPMMASPTVKAGSMARFIARDGYLYALDPSVLKVYRLDADGLPQHLHDEKLSVLAETLFPYGELLFIGARDGMVVYDLADPASPSLMGTARHLYSCDPVVVQNDVAYVTLRSGAKCRGGKNALLIFDVADPTAPREVNNLPLSSPHGLGVDGNTLFVADAVDGLLVFDLRDPQNPRPIGRAPDVKGYDVIAHAGVLIVSADDGIVQYAYGPEGITQREPLSIIPVGTGALAEPSADEVLQPKAPPPERSFAEPPPDQPPPLEH